MEKDGLRHHRFGRGNNGARKINWITRRGPVSEWQGNRIPVHREVSGTIQRPFVELIVPAPTSASPVGVQMVPRGKPSAEFVNAVIWLASVPSKLIV